MTGSTVISTIVTYCDRIYNDRLYCGVTDFSVTGLSQALVVMHLLLQSAALAAYLQSHHIEEGVVQQ